MNTKEEEFLNRLRATFRIEAAEHLQAMTTGLLELEKTPAPEVQRDLVATIFRAAHSLKGAARAVDFNDIESSCQTLEDMFASWKRRERDPSAAAFDIAHRVLDVITNALSTPKASSDTRAPVPSASESRSFATAEPVTPPLLARAAVQVMPVSAQIATPPSATEQKVFVSEDTVRITVAKLDARLVEAEEMLTVKLTMRQRADDLQELGHRFEAWRKEWAAVEPEARALRHTLERTDSDHATQSPGKGLVRLLEFFEWNRDSLKSLESNVSALTRVAQQDRHIIGKLVDDLLEDSKKLLLLPFSTLTATFPKLMRDLCRDLGKEADLVIRGEEVEMDKRVLEEMKDPLVHLLRNCIDHGIETPDLRVRAGKSARATITLAVSQFDGSNVEIVVSDDGAGIDVEKIKASAVKHGLLPAESAGQLGQAETYDLMFQPEVSSSPTITRLSGRGLGMAIAREHAEKLGGSVSVESKAGTGTRFRFVLPSMLATFRGVLIEVAGRLFVVPTAQIERVARVKAEEVKTVEGRETIVLRGRAISLVRLADVLDLPPASANGGSAAGLIVLVLGAGDQRIAFTVDAVLDEQEVLVKPLRKPLSRIRNIAGATVLGSGRVAPVLNVADLLKSARKDASAAARSAASAMPALIAAKSVLVVDDSVTSRMLIKGMLESAGYKVKTAVDGMEAFALLRAEEFDVLVSDVEMPRLNGFDLTARIRSDKKLMELPVVLVTARQSREDRERGMDLGANAYIVKSSLDQSNLLEAVRRLV